MEIAKEMKQATARVVEQKLMDKCKKESRIKKCVVKRARADKAVEISILDNDDEEICNAFSNSVLVAATNMEGV